MRLLLLITMLFTFSINHAQIRAITDTGEEVILSEDGTWKYLNSDQVAQVEMVENPAIFTKDDNSSFLLKSNNVNVGFWINPKKWKFQKASGNEAAEYELNFENGDLYGMIITEKIEMPVETLKDIAIENAKSVAPNMISINEEYRNVNGVKLLFMQMDGTTQGIDFSYYSYYFTNSNGSVQFVTYTSQNLLKDFIPDIEELLNGFVEL